MRGKYEVEYTENTSTVEILKNRYFLSAPAFAMAICVTIMLENVGIIKQMLKRKQD